MPDRHYANRPVCGTPKRKLENGERRLAPETRTQRMEMPEIARQRPAPASLSRGNINDFYRPGKISQETELRGWANRIRTKACTLYASLLADEKRARNCVAREAVSSRSVHRYLIPGVVEDEDRDRL
jgi:hypothetical protein